MGVHIENVVRVFQWKVDSDMGADTLTQRLGRGGRDFAKTVVFLSKANLSGKETTTPDHPDHPDEEHHTSTDVPKPIFNLPVTEENWAIIEQFLPLMYREPALSKKGKKKVKNESVLVPAVKWAINTTGCRHRPFLAAFQDSKIFFDNPNPDCDNCMVKHLINIGDINNPSTVLGIPLAITLAYLPYLLQNSAVPNKSPKTRGPSVNEEGLNLLVADLQDWRQRITSIESYLHPTMILGNEAIEMIRNKFERLTRKKISRRRWENAVLEASQVIDFLKVFLLLTFPVCLRQFSRVLHLRFISTPNLENQLFVAPNPLFCVLPLFHVLSRSRHMPS